MKHLKSALLFIFTFITIELIAQTNKPLEISGNVQLTNNGTAPVPLFALGRPAIMTSATFRKGNFYFNPEYNLGTDFKPWMFNTRYGYYFVDNKDVLIGVAATPSLFFLQRNPLVNNGEEFQVQRYLGLELNTEFRITPNRKFQFNYWHSVCMDKLGIENEDYISFAYSFEKMRLGEKGLIGWRPNLFYLRDHMVMEGSFASQTIYFQQSHWKCNLFVQTTVPIIVFPKTDFIWNTGINFPF